MRYLMILLCLLCISLPAIAQDEPEANAPVTIEWDRPTERLDGMPITPDEISAYEFACSETPGVYDLASVEIPGGDTDTHETARALFLPAYGEYFCALRAIDTGNRASPWSNEVTITWTPAAPSSPTIRLVIN